MYGQIKSKPATEHGIFYLRGIPNVNRRTVEKEKSIEISAVIMTAKHNANGDKYIFRGIFLQINVQIFKPCWFHTFIKSVVKIVL